eukprot:TRINITY_DN218_c0_g1_i1.p1 TRINITY_DN218_c0_g1~~TRINITY_DN218_c0_g1_i1.p1  ORF type:complete len:362 (+),score=91.12 TRINITY_DN218_c0_g1_i1:56-1141(+)
MKALRAKRLKKLLLYYKVHYGIEPPFRVIVDGSFMLYALEKKLYFREQLPKVLQAKAMPMVTKCIVAELRKNENNDRFGAALMAKRLEHVACGHDDHPVSAAECVKSVLESQPKTFLIATQNGDLQKALERIPGVPTLFFFNNVLTIVKPSNFERNMAGLMDKRKGYAAPEEKELARKTQKQMREVDFERQKAIDHLLRTVKPKAKGPNPLSVMKSKKGKGTQNGSNSEKKEKKKRKRNRTRSGIKKPPSIAPADGSAAAADAMDVAEDEKVDETPESEVAAVQEGEKKQKKKRHRKRKRTRGGVKRRKLSEDAVAIESADEVDSSFSGASSDEDSDSSSSESGSESSGESSGEEDSESDE